jgi:hypothetical protein
MTINVNPSQDDGCHQKYSQHDAHNGAQAHRRALCLWGQVVLKACGETSRAGRGRGGPHKTESWVLTKSQR